MLKALGLLVLSIILLLIPVIVGKLDIILALLLLITAPSTPFY